MTTYGYDGVGRKVREEVLGRVTTYDYDALGRMHRMTRWKDGHPQQVLVKDYDLLDRVVEERQEDEDGLVYGLVTYTYDDFSNKVAVTKEVQVGDAIERTEYDPFRRIVKRFDPLGHVTTIDYDDHYENALGQKVLRKITTDPMGRKTLETFDVFGNLVLLEKQDAEGKALLQEAFFYNLNQMKTRQVSTLFDPDKTIVKSWTYDSRSRLIELREAVGEPIEKVTRYTYTVDGHLETILKPDGETIIYSYDGLGRQTSIRTSDGSCHYALKYDPMGNVIESHDLVHHQTTKRTYSHFGELLAETQANYQRLQNTYDELGRRTAMIFSNGSKVLYDYTPYHMAKVERISRNGTSLYAHYYTEYDRSFNLTEERLVSKEPLYHLVDLLSRRIESDSPYSNERITYIDPCGNVRGYKRTLDGSIETSTFEYDDLNQLVQEAGLYNHNYAYDAHHNRLQKDDSTYSVNLLHELEATSEGTFEHDLNGNRIASSKNQAQYTYDVLDRLVQMRSGDLAIRFSYDSWNRCQTARYLQLSDGIWQHKYSQEFLYDDQNELGVYPRQLRILGQGKGAEIGAAIAIEQDQKVYLPIHDLFGNIIALLDPKTNSIQESYRYTVYGEEEIFASSGSQISDSFLHNPWRYQSKRKVGQLVAFGRRFYDPETGRWLSPDPKGFDEGPNLYQFLVNCPMLHFDFYGAEVQREVDFAALSNRVKIDHDFEGKLGYQRSFNYTYYPDIDYNRMQNHPIVSGKKAIGFTCGIGNTFESHRDLVKLTSRYAGNVPIESTFNATQGFPRDIQKCGKALYLEGTTSAVCIRERWMDFFENSEGLKYCEIGHSGGSAQIFIAGLTMPEKLRKEITAISIAGEVAIPNGLFGKTFNYRSTHDIVPHFQKIFGNFSTRSSKVTVLKRHPDAPIFDHSYSSPTYERTLRAHMNEFIEGIYD
ncbi:RHS repeat domain-containing protein [Simkania sp.]|uniref:RHS repeat domain-containing protein n=1 Tax=Simkania sp. TaxID=34094 RepID=UPI003B5214DC